MSDEKPQAPTLTFAEAEKVNPYELARRWADRLHLPVRVAPEKAAAAGLEVRTADHELEELATMAALRAWLDRWTAGQIHAALRTGATVEQASAAAGMTTAEMADCWREWDTGQRQLWQTYPDMARTAEHDRVAAILADIKSSSVPAPAEVEEVLAAVRAYGNRVEWSTDARREGRTADVERLDNEADGIHDRIEGLLRAGRLGR